MSCFIARVVRGLGEVILRHSPYQLSALHGYASAPDNNVPADDARLIQAYRHRGRAGRRGERSSGSSFADELERAMRAAPDTTFVWAHAGHGPAVSAAIDAEPQSNLMADISARSPWLGPERCSFALTALVIPEWSEAASRIPGPDRCGSGSVCSAALRPCLRIPVGDYYRGILGQLDPDVAEMIGHQNAERIAPFAA